MIQILGWSFFAVVILVILITMVVVNVLVVNVLNARTPERPDPPSDEARGPFTRPTAPANPSLLDHVHMRSGTIRETSTTYGTTYAVENPEHEGILPVRTELDRPDPSGDPSIQYFSRIREILGADGRSLAEISNSIHESLNANHARPGSIVRTLKEKEFNAMRSNSPTPKEDPVVLRKSRYHRDPVI